ncbi:PREDICTED: uncharacterized protein LOC104983908 [Bison bison bison]|uniref:Uncharacterized protein LOC104983908 n=1 Tax=Bison bison bison TaxID=43346 RepID=A0A6P3GYF4_BISBB|nr:PREDICTED: uncharacterized protein LOC104983908 [Bison bison bison]
MTQGLLQSFTAQITSPFPCPWPQSQLQSCPGAWATLISLLPQPPRLLSHVQSRAPLGPSRVLRVRLDTEASPSHRLLLLARHLEAKPSALSPAVRAPAHLPLPSLPHSYRVSVAPGPLCRDADHVPFSPSSRLSLSWHIFPSPSHPLLSLPPSDQLPFLLGACKEHQDCCLIGLNLNGTSLPILEGQFLRLVCVADSNPPATLSWLWEGKALSPSHRSAPGVLEIPRVGVRDGGEVTCRAQNPLGSQQVSFSLSVQKGPPPCSCETEEQQGSWPLVLTLIRGALMGAGFLLTYGLTWTYYTRCGGH